MARRIRRCDECYYWELHKHPENKESEDDDRTGSCHRFPPRLNDTEVRQFTDQHRDHDAIGAAMEMFTWAWPVTTGSDWCGEFKLTRDRLAASHSAHNADQAGSTPAPATKSE